MALFSNVEGSNAENIYHQYKSRNTIEVMIDAMKNVLEADKSYMHSTEALEGWLFINYLALQWYYKIYKMLQQKKLLATYSPKDLLMHLAEIKKVKSRCSPGFNSTAVEIAGTFLMPTCLPCPIKESAIEP